MTQYILGGGGFGKEVASILRSNADYNEERNHPFPENFGGFLDDVKPLGESVVKGFGRVVGKAMDAHLYMDKYEDSLIIGTGNPQLKQQWFLNVEQHSAEQKSFAATFPVIESKYSLNMDWQNNEIGFGSILCPGVVLTSDVKLGNFVLMNLNSTAGHGVEVGDFTTIGPGCHLNGDVKIGKLCSIGSGVTFVPGVVLPNNGIVGAGSVVTKTPDLKKIWDTHSMGYDNPNPNNNVPEVQFESYTMVGSPARVIKINGVNV